MVHPHRSLHHEEFDAISHSLDFHTEPIFLWLRQELSESEMTPYPEINTHNIYFVLKRAEITLRRC